MNHEIDALTESRDMKFASLIAEIWDSEPNNRPMMTADCLSDCEAERVKSILQKLRPDVQPRFTWKHSMIENLRREVA